MSDDITIASVKQVLKNLLTHIKIQVGKKKFLENHSFNLNFIYCEVLSLSQLLAYLDYYV